MNGAMRLLLYRLRRLAACLPPLHSSQTEHYLPIMKRLCIITALAAEARPLLDALKLRQSDARHLRVYTSEHYLLLECGPGKLNAAASTGAMLQAYPDIGAVLNVGIAGGCHDYGQSVLAHQIRDHASGAQWFPHLPDNNAFRSLPSDSIRTLDAPDTGYCSGELFDMEAAGVFSAASRYLSTSQIHCLKVVSDNPEQSIEKISKRSVIALINKAIPSIMPLLDALHQQFNATETAHPVNGEELIDSLLLRVHHTVNDERLLKKLVQQHIILTGNTPVIERQYDTAARIRQSLQSKIAAQPIVYS